MNNLDIRPASQKDAETIFGFIKELAIYEKAEHEVKTTADEIRLTLFAENSTTRALIAEREGQALGFAVFFHNYSTWLGKPGIYLEDLYVSPDFRGQGIGKALLKKIAGIAVDENCGRFEWAVLDWNTPAIEFYQSVGARPLDEWIIYRLTGDSLRDFAATD